MPVRRGGLVWNGTSINMGLGKFWPDLEISEAFLMGLEVSFLGAFWVSVSSIFFFFADGCFLLVFRCGMFQSFCVHLIEKNVN